MKARKAHGEKAGGKVFAEEWAARGMNAPFGPRFEALLRQMGWDGRKFTRAQEGESGEGRVVDAEIVGHERLKGRWRKILARAGYGTLFGALGVALSFIGAILTITIIGAPLGLPVSMLGLGFLLAAVLVLFSPEKLRVPA
jgi:hypothetical protein